MIQPYFAKMTISWAIVWVQKQHQVKSHRTVFTASNKKEPPCRYGRKLGEGNINRRTHDSQVGSGSLVIDPSSFKWTLFLEGCVLLIKSLACKHLDFGTSWSSIIMPISFGYVWLADPKCLRVAWDIWCLVKSSKPHVYKNIKKKYIQYIRIHIYACMYIYDHIHIPPQTDIDNTPGSKNCVESWMSKSLERSLLLIRLHHDWWWKFRGRKSQKSFTCYLGMIYFWLRCSV